MLVSHMATPNVGFVKGSYYRFRAQATLEILALPHILRRFSVLKYIHSSISSSEHLPINRMPYLDHFSLQRGSLADFDDIFLCRQLLALLVHVQPEYAACLVYLISWEAGFRQTDRIWQQRLSVVDDM